MNEYITLDSLKDAMRAYKEENYDPTGTLIAITPAIYRLICHDLNTEEDPEILNDRKIFQYSGYSMVIPDLPKDYTDWTVLWNGTENE